MALEDTFEDSEDESEEAELDLFFLRRFEKSSYKEGSITFFFSSSVFISTLRGLVTFFVSIDSIESLDE